MKINENLINIQKLVKSLKISITISANKYLIEANKHKQKCLFLASILKYLNIKINKPIINVYFAKKELFSSNFKSFNIKENDYLIGKLPDIKCNIINNDIMAELNELEKKFQIKYFVLNGYTNECEEIKFESNLVINNIEDIELNIDKVLELFLHLQKMYVIEFSKFNLNLYKTNRIQNAEDAIDVKIHNNKILMNKSYICNMNKSIYIYDSGGF